MIKQKVYSLMCTVAVVPFDAILCVYKLRNRLFTMYICLEKRPNHQDQMCCSCKFVQLHEYI